MTLAEHRQPSLEKPMAVRRPRKVTTRDVARECEVSVPAVYQALSGTGRLRDDTRERIIQTAQRLGFRLNHAAASTKRGNHQVIGLLISDWNMVPKALLFALILEAQRTNYRILFDLLVPEQSPHILRHDCVDGVLVFENFPLPLRQQIATLHLPTLMVNTNRTRGKGVITFDETGGVRMALEYLQTLGRRRPALVMPQHLRGHFSEEARKRAFLDLTPEFGMKALGPLRLSANLGTPATQAVKEVRDKLSLVEDADAFLLYDDRFAAPLIEACRQSGWELPQRACLFTLGETAGTLQLYPPVSSIRIPPTVLAVTIMNAMHTAIANKGMTGPTITLPYELVDRTE